MKKSKLGFCRRKSGLFCHAKILVNTCWPRMQKFTLKVKSSLKNVFFWRCGQNDGGYLEYRSSEHDTLFKTLLRDVFSSKLIHGIISLKFMKNFFTRPISQNPESFCPHRRKNTFFRNFWVSRQIFAF